MSAPLHIIVHDFKSGQECYAFYARDWANHYPVVRLAEMLRIPYDEDSDGRESLSHFVVDNGIEFLEESL